MIFWSPNVRGIYMLLCMSEYCLSFIIDRDIHIIELLSVASFSLQGHQLATVELNIESVVSPPRKTQLLLILKSHQPVKWKVTTRRLRRTIDIIVSAIVPLFLFVTSLWVPLFLFVTSLWVPLFLFVTSLWAPLFLSVLWFKCFSLCIAPVF